MRGIQQTQNGLGLQASKLQREPLPPTNVNEALQKTKEPQNSSFPQTWM